MSWPTCSGRRLALLLLVLAAACAAPGARSAKPCPVVAVDNRGFEDVVVYHEPLGRRLGMVGGLTQRALRDCALAGEAPRFYVRAIGGAWGFRLEGTHRMERGTAVLLVIESSEHLSYVTGQ